MSKFLISVIAGLVCVIIVQAWFSDKGILSKVDPCTGKVTRII